MTWLTLYHNNGTSWEWIKKTDSDGNINHHWTPTTGNLNETDMKIMYRYLLYPSINRMKFEQNVRMVKTLMLRSRWLDFEDGFFNQFHQDIFDLAATHQKELIYALFDIYIYSTDNSLSMLIMETFRAITHIESIKFENDIDIELYKQHVRIFLEYVLITSNSSAMKDEAALGLATLDYPDSINAVRIAADKEVVPELKENILQVLDQLIATKNKMLYSVL